MGWSMCEERSSFWINSKSYNIPHKTPFFNFFPNEIHPFSFPAIEKAILRREKRRAPFVLQKKRGSRRQKEEHGTLKRCRFRLAGYVCQCPPGKCPGQKNNVSMVGSFFFRNAPAKSRSAKLFRSPASALRPDFYRSFSVASPAIAERIARIQNPMTILLSGTPIISK